MNKKSKNISVLLLTVLCVLSSKAQDTLYYEFECDYLEITHVCATFLDGDSILVVSNLFNEVTSDDVAFRFHNDSTFLIIDGQEGLFFGDTIIGSWNTTDTESERFTIKWDSSYCSNTNEIIYKFEFAPYYNGKEPYIAGDGTKVYHRYYDMTSYYWTRSAGVVAIDGDWLFVRKDCELLKQCISKFR